ncbi:hypothetical protein BZA05DRAFT_261589 [Tricharina praecox]|uniref:uncharacterized protein n=1 Tax=Tricharina praecox TaxID=43433 RepID=UPI00221FF8A6|nr:uncharacterized protein BZA05DRAFT_261589 [Tricharina praecox]KAI5854269.1 hypothetical protein BZA05DRAFT_261589 [Tricharina praecox]
MSNPAPTTSTTSTTPAAVGKDYTLHCHCRTHVATLHSFPLETCLKITCNCSICTDRGVIMAYTPGTSVSFTIDGKEVYGSEALELLKDSLATYEFGQKQVQWRFCNRCGSNILGVKEGVWGFNLRCVDGIDLKAFKLVEHDGRST